MPARGSRSAQQARLEAERARRHAARQAWHEGQIRRRVRDNIVAGVVGGLVVVAAFASQVVHAQATAPEPQPSPAVTSGSTPAPTESPLPSDVPEPTDTPAP